LAAAMTVHGIQKILTFNGPDFKKFTGLVILDPAAV
jgi:predicted nucleic acid-binding protein